MLYSIFMFLMIILALFIFLAANPLFFGVDGGSLKAGIIFLAIIWFSSEILGGIGIRGDISALIIGLSIGWIILQSIIHEPVKNDEAPDNDLKDKDKPVDKPTEESESKKNDNERERQTNTDKENSTDPINNRLIVMENNIKKLTCEICGSNDLIKENGLYVCQHCGTKYTVEEARQLFNSVTVDIDINL